MLVNNSISLPFIIISSSFIILDNTFLAFLESLVVIINLFLHLLIKSSLDTSSIKVPLSIIPYLVTTLESSSSK